MARRKRRHLDFRNSVQKKTFVDAGLDYYQIIKFTGYFVVCHMSQVLRHSIRKKYPEAISRVICSGNVEIHQHIFFLQRRITLSLIDIPARLQSNRLGLRILNAQVKMAQRFGMTRFRATAFRDTVGESGKPPDAKWIGYRVWAKMGFIMIPASEMRFQDFLRDRNIPPMSLRELQLLPPDASIPALRNGGYTLWKEEGETWIGYFDLTPGSVSLEIFEGYKKEKGFRE